MPDCDMALVHDDDLEQILRVNDGSVSHTSMTLTHTV